MIEFEQRAWQGDSFYVDGQARYLGLIPLVTATVSADAGVTHTRLWALTSADDTWRLISALDDTVSLEHTLNVPFAELTNKQKHGDEDNALSLDGANINFATPFKGWVVWAYDDGRQNIVHSWVGDPLRIAEVDAKLTEANRGETYTMSDNEADRPVAMHRADDALIILGNLGVHAQVHRDKSVGASGMSPPKQLPQSKGTLGPNASCRWRSDDGYASVVFVDKNATGIWEVVVDNSFDGEKGFRLKELNVFARNILDWLFDTNPTPFNGQDFCHCGVDERTDSLCIVYGKRMIRMRRQSLVDGSHQWEKHDFNVTDDGDADDYYRYWAFSPTQGIKAVRDGRGSPDFDSGHIDEVFYDSTSDWDEIDGATRDGGAAIATDSAYWRSKVFSGTRRRANHFYIDRETLTDRPKLKAISDRQTATKQIGSGKKFGRFGPKQTGYNHQYEIILPAAGGKVYGVRIREDGPIGSRFNA